MTATAVSFNERPLAPVYYAPQAAYTPNAGPGYFPAPYHPYHEQKPSLLTSAFHVLKGVVTAPIDIVKGVIEHPESLILIAGLGALSVICPPVGVGLAVLGAGGAIIGGVDSTIKSVEAAERGDTAASNYYAEEVGKNIFNGALSFIGLKGAMGAAKSSLVARGAKDAELGMGELTGFKRIKFYDSPEATAPTRTGRIFGESVDIAKGNWAKFTKNMKLSEAKPYDKRMKATPEEYTNYKAKAKQFADEHELAIGKAPTNEALGTGLKGKISDLNKKLVGLKQDLEQAKNSNNLAEAGRLTNQIKTQEASLSRLEEALSFREHGLNYARKMETVYDAGAQGFEPAFKSAVRDADWARTQYNVNQARTYAGRQVTGLKGRYNTWLDAHEGLGAQVKAGTTYAWDNKFPIAGAYAATTGPQQLVESLGDLGNDEHPFYQTYGFYGPQVHAYG